MGAESKNCPVVFSEYDDIFSNLALEEILLTASDTPMPIAVFSSNSDAVVVGKHQNPWAECDPANLSALDIALARRISGGGAVYHDKGNLNYSFILPKESYHRPEIHAVVVQALQRLGLEASIRNKSSIFVAGKKVSGSAFCYKSERVLHHGTLLVDADLQRLRSVLGAYVAGIESKAIESVSASVCNLADLIAEIDVHTCADLIARVFCERYGLKPIRTAQDELADPAAVIELRESRKNDNWIYGNTPKFQLQWQFEDSSPVVLAFEKGRLVTVSSAVGDGNISPQIQRLVGLRLDEILVD